MRGKVKTFFHVFANSLIPHYPYYKKLTKTSYWFSIKYFLTLILLLNLLFLSAIAVKYNPNKVNSYLSGISASLKNFPPDLVISVKKGTLTTNYNHPFFLWTTFQDKKNLIAVVDESAGPEKITVYNSNLLFTRRQLVTQNYQPGINEGVTPLSFLDNQTINKQRMVSLTKVIDFVQILFPFVYLGVMFMLLVFLPLISLFITGLYLVFASLIAYVVSQFMFSKKIAFKKVVHVALHAATLPLLLDYFLIVFKPMVQNWFNVSLSRNQIPFPLLFLGLLALFVSAGVYEANFDQINDVIRDHTSHKPHHKKS